MAGFVGTLFIIQVGFTVTREITRHLMDGVDPLTSGRLRWRRCKRHDRSLTTAEGIGSRVTSAVFDAVPAARRLNWILRAD